MVKYCKYEYEGVKCMEIVPPGEEYCPKHRLTREEVQVLKSVAEKLDEEEFVKKLKIDSREKIVKLMEEVILTNFKRFEKFSKREEELNNDLTKLSNSLINSLTEFNTYLTNIEEMGDIDPATLKEFMLLEEQIKELRKEEKKNAKKKKV